MFLTHTQKIRMELFNEAAQLASDPVLYKRRFRMLHQLSDYESQIIKKIYAFESDNPLDYDIGPIVAELNLVINRSA